MNTLYLYHFYDSFSTLQLLPPPILSQIHDFYNYGYTHTHILLSTFSVAYTYMCLGLTTWDWINYQSSHI